jgi:hypothetical protein
LAIGPLKPDASLREPVQIRGLGDRIAIAADARVEVVYGNEEHVGFTGIARGTGSSQEEAGKKHRAAGSQPKGSIWQKNERGEKSGEGAGPEKHRRGATNAEKNKGFNRRARRLAQMKKFQKDRTSNLQFPTLNLEVHHKQRTI